MTVDETIAFEKDMEQLRESACQAANMLKALGNEYRLLILCNLLHGELQVNELQERIGLSQSALSQHLARLRHEGLVQTRRQSQAIFYSLSGDEAKRILETLYELYCGSSKSAQKVA